VKCHVALIATGLGVTEIFDDIAWPLIGLGQQHPAREFVVDDLADAFEECVRLRQVLAVGALTFKQVGHGVQPEPVDTEVEPEPHDVEHRLLNSGVVVVEIRLMVEEPVPVELAADRIKRPVRVFGVDEDDPGVRVLVAAVAPHVVIAVWSVGVAARLLEPGVRFRRVVHHQVGDDPDAPPVRSVEELDEVIDGAELRQHLIEVADVITAVAQRRIVKRWQPNAVDAQPLQVVDPFGKPAQITESVSVGVVERPDQHFVENRVLEPG
jgi:hypothetical protein